MENSWVEKCNTTGAEILITTVQILIVIRLKVIGQKQLTTIADVEVDLLSLSAFRVTGPGNHTYTSFA